MARTISRDKQSNYAEVKDTKYSDTYAWSQWDNNEWVLVHNCSVVANINFETTKEKRDDMTGYKKYRIVTKHIITIRYRLAYQVEIELDKVYLSGGEKQSLLRLIELFGNGWFDSEAKFKAWNMAHKENCSDYAMLKAENDCWDIEDDAARNKNIALNLLNLAKNA